MTPTPPWRAVRALFEQALALPADEREALLAEPGRDAALAAEVRSLLAHALADTGGRLSEGALRDTPLGAGESTQAQAAHDASAALPQGRALSIADGGHADAPPDSRVGQRLGAWRIDALLGRGGMGEVWLAERDDGHYRGQAAIKVLKRGMDSAAVLARFAQEQQALARLAHPHIARLLDAGRTADDLPYFVMEHVRGRPIDQACAGQPLAARLRLFLQLADAVSHAHRNLLVHRDLKPGNVLVDDEGQVKLLDFGIAKALDALEGGGSSHTQVGERPFTPHYASPEQVRGEAITTATDIYSLGVLLYVMLTGQRPYGRAASTPAEAARCVLEEEPSRPSRLALPRPGWEHTRRQLQGDLDNILLKSLAKEPEARYASVDALAADIGATLGGFPVSARPASWGYRTRKLLLRHRLASAAVAAAACSLVAGAALALWQAREAERERAAAELRFAQVRQLTGQLVFKYHDQMRYLGGATQVRAALLNDAARFMDSLRDAAARDPALARELADTYDRIAELQGGSETIHTGQFAEAEANLDKALALQPLYLHAPGTTLEQFTDAIGVHSAKAQLRQRQGRLSDAAAALRDALPLVEQALARPSSPHHSAALTSAIDVHIQHARLLGVSVAYANLGRLDEARRHVDAALAHAQELLRASPDNVESINTYAVVLGERANWRTQTGDHEGAVADFGEQLALRERNAERRPQDEQFRQQRVVVRGNLAGALGMAGRHAEARARMAEAQALARELAAADPGNKAAAQRLQVLAVLDARLRVLADDAALAKRVLERALPDTPAGTAFASQRWRAEALIWAARAWRGSDAARAIGHAEEAAALMAGNDENAARAWMLALARGERALALAATGQVAVAQAAAREALGTWPGPVPGSYLRFVVPVRALAR